MNKLDAVLAEVWDETAVAIAEPGFNATVLERLARRRARREFMYGTVLAIAIWAIALLLGPLVTKIFVQAEGLAMLEPVLIAGGLIASGLGLWMLKKDQTSLLTWMHSGALSRKR
jgi:hypothetical protein